MAARLGIETARLHSRPIATQTSTGCEPYREDNLLDRLSRPSTREVHYRHLEARERELVAAHLPHRSGDVLSVGCGWHPGRHLFPAPAFHLTAVDSDPQRVEGVRQSGAADQALTARAGQLDRHFAPHSFDVILYRLVLHHIAFQGPLQPCFDEAARLLKPSGALVAIEPGLWHPVGFTLALANRKPALASALHGTPDDIPLSPTALKSHATRAGLRPELHAVTYTWRRMPPALQRLLQPLDAFGSRPRAAGFGHTLLLIGRNPQ